MTSYAPTFTPRLRCHYIAWGIPHTIQARVPRGTSTASLLDRRGAISALFSIWADDLADDFAFTSAEYAEQDSDLFTPADPPVIVSGAVALADVRPTQRILSTTFSGRAPGSKARVSLYGIRWNFMDTPTGPAAFDDDTIVTADEDSRIADSVAQLTTQLYAGSGQATVWYARATLKINDFLLKRVRRGLIT